MNNGLSGPVYGGGLADMQYSTDGGTENSVAGGASTQTWYQDGQPALAFLKLQLGQIFVQFGVLGFTGTGSYSTLPYLMFIDPALYTPGVTGVYTDVAYPPAPDPPEPDFTVVSFEVGTSKTVWVAQLVASLVWFSPTVVEPPVALTISSLTLTITDFSGDAAGEAIDFDTYGAEQFAGKAAECGLDLEPANVPRRVRG